MGPNTERPSSCVTRRPLHYSVSYYVYIDANIILVVLFDFVIFREMGECNMVLKEMK